MDEFWITKGIIEDESLDSASISTPQMSESDAMNTVVSDITSVKVTKYKGAKSFTINTKEDYINFRVSLDWLGRNALHLCLEYVVTSFSQFMVPQKLKNFPKNKKCHSHESMPLCESF